MDSAEGPISFQPHRSAHAAVRVCVLGWTKFRLPPIARLYCCGSWLPTRKRGLEYRQPDGRTLCHAGVRSAFRSNLERLDKVADVTELIREHIAAVYQENSPQRIYFLMLFSIFSEFLEDVSEDVLPNERTGYQESAIWQKLYSFQKDAATGIINKLETYNGCILADSVGLGKTFTALAVIKYYELRNRSVLVLCPKKLADNWVTYTENLKNNPLVKDRFSYDVLCHTDLLRDRGESLGMPAESSELEQLRPRRDRRVPQLPQRRCIQE